MPREKDLDQPLLALKTGEARAKEYGRPSEAGKGKEVDSTLEPPEGTQP